MEKPTKTKRIGMVIAVGVGLFTAAYTGSTLGYNWGHQQGVVDTKMKSEERWKADKVRYGWELPPPAAWPLRLWGIRHFRAGFVQGMAERWAESWNRAGIGFGGISQYDLWVIYAIKRGWC